MEVIVLYTCWNAMQYYLETMGKIQDQYNCSTIIIYTSLFFQVVFTFQTLLLACSATSVQVHF